MTTQQIRTITAKATLLLEQIDELEGMKKELTQPYWNETEAKAGTKEYNMRILNLEAELKALWKRT